MANERRRRTAVSIGNWMWTLLLASIPVVNLIFFIVTAFATRKASKRSWAIATLIWIGIVIVLTACIVIFFSSNLVSGAFYFLTTPLTDLSFSGFLNALIHPALATFN